MSSGNFYKYHIDRHLVAVIPEYQCLTSIPGVGKVYAAGLIAEIGQIERFEDQTKLAKYAGLSWKVNQSGNYQSQNTPLTKQGNRYSSNTVHYKYRFLNKNCLKLT
ncbi:hypothetical protein EfmAA242_02200 [Enterococcus faecium]|nr:hypothetical protein EfmAA242_02200 [Enterococcus faecium]